MKTAMKLSIFGSASAALLALASPAAAQDSMTGTLYGADGRQYTGVIVNPGDNQSVQILNPNGYPDISGQKLSGTVGNQTIDATWCGECNGYDIKTGNVAQAPAGDTTNNNNANNNDNANNNNNSNKNDNKNDNRNNNDNSNANNNTNKNNNQQGQQQGQGQQQTNSSKNNNNNTSNAQIAAGALQNAVTFKNLVLPNLPNPANAPSLAPPVAYTSNGLAPCSEAYAETPGTTSSTVWIWQHTQTMRSKAEKKAGVSPKGTSSVVINQQCITSQEDGAKARQAIMAQSNVAQAAIQGPTPCELKVMATAKMLNFNEGEVAKALGACKVVLTTPPAPPTAEAPAKRTVIRHRVKVKPKKPCDAGQTLVRVCKANPALGLGGK